MKKFVALFVVLYCVSNGYASKMFYARLSDKNVGRFAHVNIIVPDSYKTNHKKYPVVYMLHGFGGLFRDYPGRSNLQNDVDTYDVIAVCPFGQTDSWYFDSKVKKDYKFETFVSKELVEYIDKNYRTFASREGRAITGLSMGGHGAMYIGLRHPDLFKSVASMSGGLDICAFSNRQSGIWRVGGVLGSKKDFPEVWKANSAMAQINPETAKTQNILFDCGTEDFFHDINGAFDKRMTELNVKHTYEEYPGSHSWEYWTAAVPRHLAFFVKSFKKDGLIK